MTYLDHVLLHTLRITTSQNAQQLVVRNKEESWESVPLRIQIVVERFLTLLQPLGEIL